jgi:hypothetical protein
MFMNKKSGPAGFYGGDKYSDAGGVECSKESFFRSGALLDTQALLCKYESPWEVIFVLARSSVAPAACTVTRASIKLHHINGEEE